MKDQGDINKGAAPLTRPMTGRELMEQGLLIRIYKAPEAKIFVYQRVKE